MKKIPTLFVRDFTRDNGRYVTREVTPGCEWVLAGEGFATRKWDGTCVRVRNDGTYAIYARREVKPGKLPPAHFEQVDHDDTTGKRIGWEPWSSSPFARYIEEARKGWAVAHPLPDAWISDVPPGTYELVGPKINGNPEGYASHILIPHGRTIVDLDARTFDGMANWTAAHPHIEGIVFWRERGNPDAGMVKIKRRDFRALSEEPTRAENIPGDIPARAVGTE